MYVRSAFFVCERHIESGEYFIKKTPDGFRSTDIAQGPLPAVSAIAAAQSGLVLVALADGRIMRTLDDFQTVTFVHPGVCASPPTPPHSCFLNHLICGGDDDGEEEVGHDEWADG